MAEHHGDGVRAFAEEGRDVVGHIEDALVVGRPGRVEDVVPGLAAVEAELVVAEAGDVGPGPLDPALERELLAELVLLPDPDALPIALVEEPGVEAGDGAPGAFAAVPVPGPDLPVIGLAAFEGLPGEDDLDGLGRRDLAAVPDVARGGLGIGRDEDLVGRLDLAALRVLEDPEEAGLGHVDAHRVLEVFAAERRRGEGPRALGGERHGRSGQNERKEPARIRTAGQGSASKQGTDGTGPWRTSCGRGSS